MVGVPVIPSSWPSANNLAHPFGVSATVQAVLEGGRLKPERLGMLGKLLRRQRLLVAEQPSSHITSPQAYTQANPPATIKEAQSEID